MEEDRRVVNAGRQQPRQQPRERLRDTHLWSIYWVDDNGTALQPPLIGAFENGIGTFFADDTFHGQAIRVRFIWDAITDNSARWEQAFSIDHGAQWEVNWVMRFTRKRE